jgi:hypothetical protein
MGSTILRADSFARGVILGLSLFIGGASATDSAKYDTAWTMVYDGGKTADGTIINDVFRDVKALANGNIICVGETRDSGFIPNLLLIEFDPIGGVRNKKLFSQTAGLGGSSLTLAKNGDYLIGGYRYTAPNLIRLDKDFKEKFSTWYYDSTMHKHILARSAMINGLIETKDGRILAIAGDAYPNNNGNTLNNYAALLEYDSLGKVKPHTDWLNTTGYELAGWSLAPAENGGFMLGGKQSVFKIDTTGVLRTKSDYSFTLPGVGSELNNVSRVRQLRDGRVMVAGQSYEEDCWTKYQRLYYDAWWSPLSPDGSDGFRYTAGVSGAEDYLYDFTQLADGRIAFIGGKGGSPAMGIWVFVTDSTGKNIQWQNEYNLPGLVNGRPRNNILPLSVAATPDSGFILVGFEGSSNVNANACAFKFVPKPLPASILNRTGPAVRPLIGRKAWVFAFDEPDAGDAHLEIFSLQGRKILGFDRHLSQAGQASIHVDVSALKPGSYVWKLTVGNESRQGIIPKAE